MNKISKFFYSQCCGMYSGHMAAIPNNPLLFSLFSSFGQHEGHSLSEKAFANALRSIADSLDPRELESE